MFTISCNNIDKVVWKNADTCLFNNLQCASVWQIRISNFVPAIHHFVSLLSPDEIENANHFNFEKDKNSYIIRWGILRLLLSEYLHQNAATIAFGKGKNKKPFVLQNEKTVDVYFNISHSDDCVLIAFANSEIGIDAEKIDRTFNYRDMLPVLFSPKETNAINISADAAIYFYKFFTRKESLLKATANGIGNYIIIIPVLDGDHSMPENNEVDIKSNWQLSSFKLEDNYTASIAYAADIENIEFYRANETLIPE